MTRLDRDFAGGRPASIACGQPVPVLFLDHADSAADRPRVDEQGFELRWLSEPGAGYGVGVHRFTGTPRPLRTSTRLFEFVGYDVLRQRETAQSD
ncbi:hypothetical protein ACFU98_45530 [Streptomyces sp. NPDC057575]|uniref:hypothetical protein n=1 Tax=unclassified Streptomyces TaxID=2593676 RepID=UPI0036C503F2